jgi:predicted phosphodiesterase
MKISHLSDIHLDAINDQELIRFAEQVRDLDLDAVLITGDISNAKQVVYHLSVLEKIIQRQIFYVLGNHDFYASSITSVRKSMAELSTMSQYLRYLPTTPYVKLSAMTALVGHDGWYDALNGDPNSTFMLNDFIYIEEYKKFSGGGQFMNVMGTVKDMPGTRGLSLQLSKDAVKHMADGIKAAVGTGHKEIIIATHVPPFKESHIYNGMVGDENAQPWFTSKTCGDMLRSGAAAYKNVNFTVFCGHTHGKFMGKFADNLTVHVAGAEYGTPRISGTFVVK